MAGPDLESGLKSIGRRHDNSSYGCGGVACQPEECGERLSQVCTALPRNHVIPLIGSEFYPPNSLCDAGLILLYLYKGTLGLPIQLLWWLQHLELMTSVWLSLLAWNPRLMYCGSHKQIEHVLGVYESVNQCLIVQFKLRSAEVLLPFCPHLAWSMSPNFCAANATRLRPQRDFWKSIQGEHVAKCTARITVNSATRELKDLNKQP